MNLPNHFKFTPLSGSRLVAKAECNNGEIFPAGAADSRNITNNFFKFFIYGIRKNEIKAHTSLYFRVDISLSNNLRDKAFMNIGPI